MTISKARELPSLDSTSYQMMSYFKSCPKLKIPPECSLISKNVSKVSKNSNSTKAKKSMVCTLLRMSMLNFYQLSIQTLRMET
jgi:hypothetical protein